MATDTPKHLYHGTSTKRLRAILRRGLQPRGNAKSHWEMASRQDHVYLTSSYPIHFGRQASDNDGGPAKHAVLRIRLDRIQTCRLYADEDALESANRKRDMEAGHFGDMTERTAFYRDNWDMLEVAKNWQGSLALLGNCSHHGPIPVDAIDAVAIIENASPLSWLCDPTITAVNYGILGGYYRALTRFPFEGERAIDEEIAEDGMVPQSYGQRLRGAATGFTTFHRPPSTFAQIMAEAERPLVKTKRIAS